MRYTVLAQLSFSRPITIRLGRAAIASPSSSAGRKYQARENPENTLTRRRRRPSRPPAEGARGTPPPSASSPNKKQGARDGAPSSAESRPLPQSTPLGGAQIPRPRRDPSPLFLW